MGNQSRAEAKKGEKKDTRATPSAEALVAPEVVALTALSSARLAELPRQSNSRSLRQTAVQQMQRGRGNAHVQRMLAQHRGARRSKPDVRPTMLQPAKLADHERRDDYGQEADHVSDVVSHSTIHRQESEERYGRTQTVPGASSGSKKPTPQQTAQLTRLRGKIESLEGRADATNADIQKRLTDGKKLVDDMEGYLGDLSDKYKQAYERHKGALDAINQNAKSDEAYISIVLGIGLGLAAPYVGTAWAAIKGVEKGFQGASRAMAAMGLEAVEKTTEEVAFTSGKVLKSAEAAAAGKTAHAARGREDASPLGTSLPAFRELQIVKQISKLKDGMMNAANAAVNLKPLDKAATECVRDIAVYVEHGSGTTVSNPVDVVIATAEKLAEYGPRAYQSVEQVSKKGWEDVKKMADAMRRATESATVDKMEEKIWIEWLATVPTSQLGLIDELEGTWVRGPYLPRRVLELLGSDPGLGWTSHSDLLNIHYNAQHAQRAQAQVGKTGYYQGPTSVTTTRRGRASISGDEFPAQIEAIGTMLGPDDVGFANVPVVVIGTFITGKAAGPGVDILQARERFGLTVQALEGGNAPVQF